MKKCFYFFFGCFLLLFSSSLRAQNSALSFDGNGDYVDCGNNAALNATNIKTMECWVKFNDLTNAQEILSRSTNSNGIELLIFGGNLAFYCMGGTSNSSYFYYPASQLTTGVWYHIAATWNGSKESMQLYVNGIAVGSRGADVGDINISGITNPAGTFRIGQWSQSGDDRFFNGQIDEIRIWDQPRSASAIKSGMYGTVAANTPNLVAYYKANEGSGTSLANSTATTGLNGTLMGSTSWLTPSPVQWANNALYFDGIDDFVQAPNTSGTFDITTGTIECWVRPHAFHGNSTIIATRIESPSPTTRYSFHMNNNQVGLWNGITWNPVTYTPGFTPDTWYHLAFVCTPSSTTIYVNGDPIGTTGNVINTANNNLPLQIGLAYPAAGGEQFEGVIDEVRIWNSALAQSDIQANMNQSLTGSESGLLGLFSFNQGAAAQDNAGLYTAIDGTSNNNHATLYNFALNGNTSNWVSHTDLTALPVSLVSFTANKASGKVLLNWTTASEANNSYFEVQRSSNNGAFQSIGSIQAAGNSSRQTTYSLTDNSPATGKNLYRLKQVDRDGKTQYSSILTVNMQNAKTVSLSVYPVPVHNVFSLNITSSGLGTGTFTLFNLYGKALKAVAVNLEGSSALQMQRDHLPSGVYFYQLKSANGSVVASGKLVFQ